MDWNFKTKSWLMNGAATGLALIMMGSSIAHAQDAATAEPAATEEEEDETARLDAVKVTGIRGSLESSVGLKKGSDLIVEAITAEDIGKLPDVSIAESLARLPGLAIQRIDGRGQQLSVRGLGPDFNSAILNGREQVTTGDNRGVEFDQFPSELLSGVVVYKSPDAGLIGQGFMGTVDLRTIRPLSQDERVVVFGGRYEWNDQGALAAGSEDDGYRANFTYVDQFANGTIGVALGVATMSTPTQGNIYNAWGFPDLNGSSPAQTTTPFADSPLVLGGAKPYAKSNELERTGVIGTFEFEPSATLSSTVDIFYSDFQETQYLRGIELPLAWGYNGFWDGEQATFPGVTLAPGFTVEDGVITSGTFQNVSPVIRNDLFLREAELFSLGWNIEGEVGEYWTLGADVSTSQVNRVDTSIESYSGTGYRGNGVLGDFGFQRTSEGYFVFNPSLNYGDPNLVVLTSPQGWGRTDAAGSRPFGQQGYFNNPRVEDDLYALRLTAERDLDIGIFDKMKFGANISSREKTKDAQEFFVVLPNGNETAPIPQQVIVGSTNFSFLGLGDIISYDPRSLIALGAVVLDPNEDDDVITKSWGVQEDVYVGYAQLDIDTGLGSIPVSGNVGLQVVYTEQSSTGGGADEAGSGNFVPVTGGDSYTEYLPSLNLTFELPADQYIRFAANRTMARQRMDDLRASQTVDRNAAQISNPNPTANASYFNGSGGNPELRPYLANAVDLSYEKYFGGAGYVSVAVFYKDLENWILNDRVQRDFSYAVPLLSPAEQAALGSTIGFFSQPVNLEGGYIQGVEIAGSLPFDIISPALEGFGLIGSASFTESEIEPRPGDVIAIPGLSETVANVTAYYENYGFNARVSARYRDEFLGEVSGFGANRETRTVEAETVIDAQIGYDFGAAGFEGPLSGLSILLQGQNLTDEEFVTSFDNGEVRDYQLYGSTYLLGFSYKFQ